MQNNLMEKRNRIKELVSICNFYRDAYYNRQESLVSDYVYDSLFDELIQLEDETGYVLSNSPTQTVGYEVKSELKKVTHSHKMLSLDKTKDVNDLKKFADGKDYLLSLKMDGLTILLTYEDGVLIKAETRGNGEVGEDITHNARVFENIPTIIDKRGFYEIEGEAIITYEDFQKINEEIEKEEDKYKNPRNLASGSVRQLDNRIAARRHLKFVAWKIPGEENSFVKGLDEAKKLGFDIVPYHWTNDTEHIEDLILSLKKIANKKSYPIDGLVITYDDIKYGESLGQTGHHPKHSLAFKFGDEEYDTTLIDIDWTLGKTGQITPTAVFEPVEIDGTIVERASVHNISILTKLELLPGDKITVYKANQIIPQIADNLSKKLHHPDTYMKIPGNCPVCGGVTEIRQENDSKVLVCTNENCKGKLLKKCAYFVSKDAMDISGLSEATLSKFIELGWINSLMDIYNLKNHEEEMKSLEGFGEKSANRLLEAIENSKIVTLDKFIASLSIPLVGRTASKTISKYFGGDFEKFYNEGLHGDFAWTMLEDFGEKMEESLLAYVKNDTENLVWNLSRLMNFQKPKENSNEQKLSGKVFVITGKVNVFKNRDEAKEKIETAGGKVAGSVSKATHYLVNNDITSTSGKNKKAKELGIPIITEEELIQMLK